MVFLPLALCALAARLAAAPTVTLDVVLARARAALGPEPALDAVQSISYIGRVELDERGGKEPHQSTGTMELTVLKPNRQRLVQVLDGIREIIGINETEGWHRTEPVGQPFRARVTLLDRAMTRRMQAYAFENLSFYRGLEKLGGRVELRNETGFAGHPAVEVAFIHPDGVTFLNTFDIQTGKLLQTVTDDGITIQEEGEVRSGGIVFPHKVTSVQQFRDGRTRTIVVTFDEIRVNPKIDPASFLVTMPGQP